VGTLAWVELAVKIVRNVKIVRKNGFKIQPRRKIKPLVVEHNPSLEAPAQPSIRTRLFTAAPALLWLR
jgi:hypothetical protein